MLRELERLNKRIKVKYHGNKVDAQRKMSKTLAPCNAEHRAHDAAGAAEGSNKAAKEEQAWEGACGPSHICGRSGPLQ